MKIYTRTGDDGTTALLGGDRVPKHHLRIETYGAVDELNANLGLLKDQNPVDEYNGFIKDIQDNLFTIGSHLATGPGASAKLQLPEINADAVEILEQSIDKMDEELPPLRNFVLPGGHVANSAAHVARCVCRRAERLAVHLNDTDSVDPVILKYLNRLSDWLFSFSRLITHRTGSPEIAWTPRSKK